MNKNYKYTPENFNDIKDYIIESNYIEDIIKAKYCFFYDTCSILTHSNSMNRNKIIDYIKIKKGVVIITRTVLMELQDKHNIIQQQQVDYLKELYLNSVKIILLNEEDIFKILNQLIDTNISESNKLLGYSIIQVSNVKGTIYDIKNNIAENIFKEMMDDKKNNKKELYTEFFELARNEKKSNDNLGEELMFICFIVLTRTKLIGKLVFLSNDLKSRDSIISLNLYTKKHFNREEPYQLTSSTMVYNLFKEKLIEQRSEMSEMLNTMFNGNITIYYMGEYDISLRRRVFDIDELINYIFDNNGFKVIY